MIRLVYPGTDRTFEDVHVQNIQIASAHFRTDDAPLPRQDNTVFGQDFTEPGDILLHLSINSGGVTDPLLARRIVREQAEGFTSVWDASTLRSTPGALAELWCEDFDLFEGRPRGVEWDWENYAVGFLTGRARFVRAHSGSYARGEDGSAVWHSVEVGLVPAQYGGLLAPLVAPLSTAVQSTRARPFEVGGEVPAWPIIEISGPLQSGGSVELTHGWSLHLNRALQYDDVIRIDTRPGRRGMWINGRPANVLSPTGARLAQLSLPPGVQEIALRGSSVEGTAKVTMWWRDMKAGI